jgi:hypothetical protein
MDDYSNKQNSVSSLLKSDYNKSFSADALKSYQSIILLLSFKNTRISRDLLNLFLRPVDIHPAIAANSGSPSLLFEGSYVKYYFL